MTETPLRRSLTAEATIAIRERILSGLLPPGERILEVALSEELGLSRTPLRSALMQLEQEGLLQRRTGPGYNVSRFTLDDVIDAIELRGVLEGVAARRAAERGVTPALADKLDSILDDIDQALSGEVDLDAYSAGNKAFHDLLAVLCRSRMIDTELQRVTRLPFASPVAFLYEARTSQAFIDSLPIAQRQHRDIAEAILSRQGSRAEAIAREHAHFARKNLDHALRQTAGGDSPRFTMIDARP